MISSMWFRHFRADADIFIFLMSVDYCWRKYFVGLCGHFFRWYFFSFRSLMLMPFRWGRGDWLISSLILLSFYASMYDWLIRRRMMPSRSFLMFLRFSASSFMAPITKILQSLPCRFFLRDVPIRYFLSSPIFHLIFPKYLLMASRFFFFFDAAFFADAWCRRDSFRGWWCRIIFFDYFDAAFSIFSFHWCRLCRHFS